ncbi:glycoside hydrolase family 5 protein [Niveibacterium microcysteis]|uniref:Glycoside hydrolase family 5 protein n=1 Tax=Niveibacterium microcysteis TaxID=2811415 RepID=A0ABX7M811_9RHOO|nr:glycoside hydrolase family 5 protein [Niveibacterium microcysteis]QSI77041.1 glycoside hydrolase family 5 protein [Niveibacterium microcysteis]
MPRLFAALLLLALSACASTPDYPPPAAPSRKHALPETTGPHRFLHAAGTQWVDEAGGPVRLRGVAFGNEVYSKNPLPTTHHGEADYARLRDMGMNLVRFYLYYGTLEDDTAPFRYKQSGWDWLDRNVAWARAHGIYLILNLHVPQGGFQSLGEGGALWSQPANQDRFVALWRAIAARYADEPVIAGYDLLNEPVVPRGKQQWQQLAQRTANAIREVDRRHSVIVERVNAVAGKWDNDAEMNFVTISDPNVVYTFHFYEPFAFTHTHAPWAGMARVEGGQWGPQRHAEITSGFKRYLDWGARKGVPLYLGEFGLIRAAFEANRNGLGWAADMIDLAEAANLPWTWHSYHEDHFALYYGYGTPINPDKANQALIDLLRDKLAR